MELKAACNGAMRYIKMEIIPQLDGTKRMLAEGYIGLAMPNIEKIARDNINHPLIAVTGIVRDDGTIDEDKVYQFLTTVLERPQKVHIPILGDLTIDRNDADKIMNYIREG